MGMVSDNNLLNKGLEELEVPEVEESEEMLDDSFDDSIVDEQFEEGESLVGEKYIPPVKDEKFVDVGKGVVVDKKDVSPILQIKSFFENNNIKIRDPKSGCRKCYGRGYTAFDIKAQSYVPCGCLFPPQTRVQKDAEAYRMLVEGKMSNTPDAKRRIRDLKRKIQKNSIHDKVLQVFKNQDAIVSASAEYVKQNSPHILSAAKES